MGRKRRINFVFFLYLFEVVGHRALKDHILFHFQGPKKRKRKK